MGYKKKVELLVWEQLFGIEFTFSNTYYDCVFVMVYAAQWFKIAFEPITYTIISPANMIISSTVCVREKRNILKYI